MGNSESTPDGGNAADDFDGIETLGYRVLGVQPNSPASAAGLVSFFDFLIGADGEMLLGSGEALEEGEEYDDVDFPALLEKFKGKPLQLLVHNIKSQEQRLVDIVPSDDWEGAGLLGVTIRLDNYAGAEDRLIRILSTEHNSPAAIAGLVPQQDYLLGTTTHSFDSTKVLAAVLEVHVDKVVELYVYNTNSDKVRVVALMPTWSWGGNGLLGSEVGTGYLHRLPGSCRTTLGGSVERRVRWIGKNGPTSPQDKLQQAPALELEPQLEMEQDDEEEEDQGHNEEASIGTVSLASQVSAAVEPPSPAPEPAKTEAPVPVEPPKPTEVAPPAEESNSNHAASNGTAAEATEPPKTETDAPPQAETIEKAPSSGGMFIAAPVEVQNLPPTTLPPQTPTAPSPGSGGLLPADPAAQPVVVTTFIPGPKPPPINESLSAEDLFSGPPPIAKIPSKHTIVINSSVGSVGSPTQDAPMPANTNNNNNGEAVTSPAFSTPHPPQSVRTEVEGGPAPVPPVTPQPYGVNDLLPPPPKMSGAH